MLRATVWRIAALLALSVICFGYYPVAAQEVVHFPSFDDNGPGQPPTMLDGYLWRLPGEARQPAVVGLHGCSGMFSRASGVPTPLYRSWVAELNRAGYTVLLVDSFGPRKHGEMCSIDGFDLDLYRRRPRDAYGALLYLQSQPFVRGDRIGLIGWSQGGGAALYAIRTQSPARPASMSQGEFRVAVAFYPGACTEQRQVGWMSAIPLLVLMGAEDIWTPMAPCKALLDGATARGNRIETVVYPGAYHGFDAPNSARRELPAYVTRAGVVPIVGTDEAGRADSLQRVPAFLGRFLAN